MNWLKAAWAPIAAAGLVALALLAAISAARHKATADRWRDKAVDIEEGNVSRGTLTAEAANTQAKLHNARAEERNMTAEARRTQIREKNEPIANIVDNWRKS